MDHNLYGTDLSAAIRRDIKALGYKNATVRVYSYTGGQSITVTLHLKPSDYADKETFIRNYRIKGGREWIYIGDAAPALAYDRYCRMNETQRENIRIAAARYDYRRFAGDKYTVNHNRISECAHYTDETLKEIQNIHRIIKKYHFDDSDRLRDYYNVNFYYDIVTVPEGYKHTSLKELLVKKGH